jgi:hypothetical protein
MNQNKIWWSLYQANQAKSNSQKVNSYINYNSNLCLFKLNPINPNDITPGRSTIFGNANIGVVRIRMGIATSFFFRNFKYFSYKSKKDSFILFYSNQIILPFKTSLIHITISGDHSR